MEKIKCITFDKEAQDSLPEWVKDKMKKDRKKAELKMTLKEAITSIGEKQGIVSVIAREALETNDYEPFTSYVKRAYNGAAHTLAAAYGHEVIDTIIKSK